MPLTPRFTWEEDAPSIALQVTLPGSALKNVDIYISDVVLKVNAAPYVLLLDLFGEVDDASAVIKRNATTHVLHISINKMESKLWGELTCPASKAELKERRLASMDRKQADEASLAVKRKDRKYQDEKQTLRAQMAVDDTNRQILSDLKAEEKQREENAMYQSFRELQMKQQQQQTAAPTTKQPIISTKPAIAPKDNNNQHEEPGATKSQETRVKKKHVSFAFDPVTSNQKSETPKMVEEILELNADGSFDIVPAAPSKAIWDEEDTTHDDVDVGDIDEDIDDNQVEESKSSLPPSLPPVEHKAQERAEPKSAAVVEEVVAVELPPPRAATEAEIVFTPRVFPTPMRESKAAEEEDWLLKNRKHLKKHKGLRGADTYDISESDPAWLKAKGDDFYRSQDYRSALNAYSEAISILSEDQIDLLTSCLSNRAACNLQLGSFDQCLDDCSKALSFFPDTPASVAATSSSEETHARVIREFRFKLKLLVRRGTALCRLGKFTQAKADYGVALTMDKQNAALQYDYCQLLQLESSQLAKERGDECFKQSQLDEAITQYDQSLQLHPHSIPCLSNRAACHLRRLELPQCVADCTSALALLQQQPSGERPGEIGGNASGGIAFFSVAPPPGSAKRREWVIKTLVRRGMAFVAMKDLCQAESDYAAAVELDPSNTALQADLTKIRQERLANETTTKTQASPEDEEEETMTASTAIP